MISKTFDKFTGFNSIYVYHTGMKLKVLEFFYRLIQIWSKPSSMKTILPGSIFEHGNNMVAMNSQYETSVLL